MFVGTNIVVAKAMPCCAVLEKGREHFCEGSLSVTMLNGAQEGYCHRMQRRQNDVFSKRLITPVKTRDMPSNPNHALTSSLAATQACRLGMFMQRDSVNGAAQGHHYIAASQR